jgi:nucleoside 2-deoxyribosyltransferase/predicted RNA-binding Zn-ribbon protein involved in translation (DUF1610 family)
MSTLQGPPICTVCLSERTQELPTDRDGRQLDCPRCGKFFIGRTAVATVLAWEIEPRMNVSGWIREQNILGESPEVNTDTLGRVATRPLPSFMERADRLLLHALDVQPRFGGLLEFGGGAFLAIAYAINEGELRPFWDYLEEQGFIKKHGSRFNLAAAGYIRCDELQARQAASAQGFVAMSFASSLTEAWTMGFEPAIRDAGYDPVRVDGIEHSEKIDDRIIAEIRRSRFVVADFTGHRGGVYFEAGFALGLNLPVIWSCQESEIKDLHFDIRQYNTIPWRDPADLATRLQLRIEAVVGDGPRKVVS